MGFVFDGGYRQASRLDSYEPQRARPPDRLARAQECPCKSKSCSESNPSSGAPDEEPRNEAIGKDDWHVFMPRPLYYSQ